MPNQYINQVIYGDETLVDLTEDTITPSNMLIGTTAHDASGAPITGTLGTMVGATSSSLGEEGLVPAPTDTDYNKFLKGDGTWSYPDNSSWDGMTLNKTAESYPTSDVYVIGGTYVASDSRVQYKVTETPAPYVIPKYDADSYLKANTPSVGDSSNRVATTAFVSATLGDMDGIEIHRIKALPEKTVNITNGYSLFPIQTIILGIEADQNLNGYSHAWIGGTYKNLVNISNFTVTETTTKIIGTFTADTYSISFNIRNTTNISGNIELKEDNITLYSIPIAANANERKEYYFTLESTATITLLITGIESDYNYIFSNLQVEKGETATGYTPYANICPITSGYTQCNILRRAKNIWDNTTVVRQYGYYDTTGTFIEEADWRPLSFSCEEGDTFIIQGSHFKDIITFWNNSTFIGYSQDNPITVPAGVNTIIISGKNTSFGDQIYKNQYTYQYTFPQAAGTVYGGTLTINQDGTGTLISNRNIGDLGSLTWIYDSSKNVFVADCFVDQKLPSDNTETAIALCSNLPVISASEVIEGDLGIGVRSDGHYYVYYDGMGTDATAFTATMSGQTLYYEVNSPTTYNLSELEVITLFDGYNELTCNTGTIRKIEYIANVNGLINTADKLKLDALTPEDLATKEYTDTSLYKIVDNNSNTLILSGAENKVQELTLKLNYQQSGEGDPSTSNVRSLTPYSNFTLNVSATENSNEGTNYSVNFGTLQPYAGTFVIYPNNYGIFTTNVVKIDTPDAEHMVKENDHLFRCYTGYRLTDNNIVISDKFKSDDTENTNCIYGSRDRVYFNTAEAYATVEDFLSAFSPFTFWMEIIYDSNYYFEINTPILNNNINYITCNNNNVIIEKLIYQSNNNQSHYLNNYINNIIKPNQISLGRDHRSKIGENSIAIGYSAIASEDYGVSIGAANQATGYSSIALGYVSQAKGPYSIAINRGETTGEEAREAIAIGTSTKASGAHSYARGYGIATTGRWSSAFGQFNSVEDTSVFLNTTPWVNNVTYNIGDIITYQSTNNEIIKYRCIQSHSNKEPKVAAGWYNFWKQISERDNYAEIVGNGYSNNERSNARALDWQGNEYLNGKLYINCDATSSNGKEVATKEYVNNTKADKVTGATNGNFAALDTNGNLIDSGHKHTDYLAISDFVDTTYTFANGTNGFTVTPSGGSAQIVTVTPSIAAATQAANGLMSSADKTKLDTINNDTMYKTISTPAQIMTFDDGADDLPVEEMTIGIEPMQDLHGYDKPWVGGAGKNLLRITESTTTINGVTFTVNSDGTIIANASSAPSENAIFTCSSNLPFKSGLYIINGCPENGSSTTYALAVQGRASDYGTGGNLTLTEDATINFRCIVYAGYKPTNLEFKPMIRLASVSDATWEPYTNICPISGWTGAKVTDAGRNMMAVTIESVKNANTSGTWSGNTYTYADRTYVVNTNKNGAITSITINGNASAYPSFLMPFNLPKGEYIVSSPYRYRVDKNGTRVMDGTSDYALTVDSENDELVFNAFAGTGLVSNIVYTPMVRKATDSDTTHEPLGAVYSFTFPSSAGTVYGGTLKVEKDGTGTLVVDRAIRDITDSNGQYNSTNNRYIVSVSDKAAIDSYYNVNCISDQFITISAGSAASSGVGVFANGNNIGIAGFKTSESAYQTFLQNNPVSVCYKLATPVIYTIPAPIVRTLLGTNNIWSTTGPINSITYPHSTQNTLTTEERYKLSTIEEGAQVNPPVIDPYETIDTPAPLIHLTDAAEAPVKEMEIEINPVQDFNRYDHPWVGGSQKNLFPQARVSDTQSERVLVNIPAGTYTFSANVTSNDTDYDQCLVLCYYGDNTYTQFKATRGGRYSTTITFSDTVVRFNFYASTSNIESEGDTFSFNNIQLEAGSTATVYEPYENVCPISGWNTINIYDTKFNCYPEEWISDGYGINDQGNIATVPNGSSLRTDFFPVAANTIYYYNFPALTGSSRSNIFWYDINKIFIRVDKGMTSFQVTSPSNAAYAKLATSATYNNASGVYNNDICLNVYDEIRNGEYEAYQQGHEYEISLPQTVYGGKLTVYGDGSGELVSNYSNVVLTGQENMSWQLYNNLYFYTTTKSISGRKSTNNSYIKGFCNYIITNNDGYIDYQYLRTTYNNGYSLELFLPLLSSWGLSSESTSEEINAKLAELYNAGKPLQIVYELETPITYQLTSPQIQTLLSENNIWANSGNINKIIYVKDSDGLISGTDKAIIDRLVSNNPQNKYWQDDGTWNSPIAILEYGVSTWNDFLDAYNKNKEICLKISFVTVGMRIARFSYYYNGGNGSFAEFIYNRIHDNNNIRNDSTIKYVLSYNGTWTTTEQTVCEVFTGSNSSTAGKAGLVPAPSAGADNRFLRATGSWQAIDTVTTTSNGLMSKDDKVKLNKIDGDATQTSINLLYKKPNIIKMQDDTINILEENRKDVLAFLPPEQIIILKTTDGGTTWIDAEVSNDDKRKLFSSQDGYVQFPQVEGQTTSNCGIKILITNCKYDVPANTSEENKYNYWRSSAFLSQDREVVLKSILFRVRGNNVNAVQLNGTKLSYALRRATYAAHTNFTSAFTNQLSDSCQCQINSNEVQMEDRVNLEIVIMVDTPSSTATNKVYLLGINGYGRPRKSFSSTYTNNMCFTGHLYAYDHLQNAIFPKAVTATTFYGDMQPTNLNVTNDANFKGDIYVNCDSNFENGAKVATQGYVNSALAGISVEGGGGISVPMTGATANADGVAGLVPQPLTTDIGNFLSADGTWKPGGKPMVVLSYGNSTWAEFEQAYNDHVIVYCRASSNSNPASGSQTRQAFMAYVNNGNTPTEVEFQYYRSVSSHSSSQMSDQVFIYKLNKTSGWSVTTREASMKQLKVANNSNMSISYSNNVATINGVALPAVTSADNGKILKVVNGVWTAVTPD